MKKKTVRVFCKVVFESSMKLNSPIRQSKLLAIHNRLVALKWWLINVDHLGHDKIAERLSKEAKTLGFARTIE